MLGYQSTSLDKNYQIKVMLKVVNNEEIAVLYEISGLDEDGNYHFIMDKNEFSIFENEQEVLMFSGLHFQILDISE